MSRAWVSLPSGGTSQTPLAAILALGVAAQVLQWCRAETQAEREPEAGAQGLLHPAQSGPSSACPAAPAVGDHPGHLHALPDTAGVFVGDPSPQGQSPSRCNHSRPGQCPRESTALRWSPRVLGSWPGPCALPPRTPRPRSPAAATYWITGESESPGTTLLETIEGRMGQGRGQGPEGCTRDSGEEARVAGRRAASTQPGCRSGSLCVGPTSRALELSTEPHACG